MVDERVVLEAVAYVVEVVVAVVLPARSRVAYVVEGVFAAVAQLVLVPALGPQRPRQR